ncbi:hypothetical protein B0J15DRAFT_433757 [Fusarium solani]|uniref:Uncharacterized protein n=1 Tax=Fusarium solani TaxID=169388 RepID=A0A9P9JRN6_FUSSL|nr:uncharacterized protein B0J15DRAFT_433757 [Fusarium solani]KAH7230711.1 hypothetical protein B0J15DRAFT_433757 [Fusarium solani]
MTESHRSATSVGSSIGEIVDCTFCKKKSISCHYSLRRSRARKGAVAKGHDATRFDHYSSHNASTDEPAQNAIPETAVETSGASSMMGTSSHNPLNVVSPPHLHVDATTEPESPDDTACLKMILQELSTSPPRSSPLRDTDFPDTMEKWVLDCFESYVNHFHHRWHIITAPTYELKKKPYDNAASVLMIGSYFSHSTDQIHLSVTIHEKLMDHYLQLTVRVETQLSLLYRQRPRLLNKELSTPLPSTFSLRNCYDFGTFTHREKRESSGRDVKLSMMMRYPDWFLPDPLLVEDIHLGLCGLAFDLFEQPQPHSVSSARDNASAISSRANIMRRLAIWAEHIKAISQKLSSDASHPDDHDLVIAYLQREDETSALSYDRSAVKDRIQDIFQETTTLYDKLQTLLSVGK